MLRALTAVVALLALPASAAAQAEAPADDPSLPLVYVFVVDGLDGDRVDLGQAPFLARVLAGEEADARATYWQESRSIMVAETNPNHVAMATGAFADRSGIPGNAFAVQDEASKTACGGDPAETGAVEVDGETGTCMLAESFFMAAKRLAPADITTAGIFGKPKLAQIFATKHIDPNAYDADFLWSPCDPSEEADYCDSSAPARPNDGYSPVDQPVMDQVLTTVNEGVPTDGTRKRPNLTLVNLPTVDSAGHGFGTGAAYIEAIAMADAELQRFVENQRELGLWERTVMFVVSDHSMDTTLQKNSLRLAFNTAGISDSDFLAVQNGSVDMVYLKDRNRPDAFEVLKQMREVALRTTGVDQALYRVANPLDEGEAFTLDVQHPGWRVAGERTGDLFVTHVEGGAFNEPNPLTGNHGGPQTSDNTMMVIAGGDRVRQQTLTAVPGPRFDDTLLNPGQSQNVDVAPTVMALFGLTGPRNSEGRVLTEAFTALPQGGTLAGSGGDGGSCTIPSRLRAVRVSARGRRVRFAFERGTPVRADIVQEATGRRVLRGRVVRRLGSRTGSFTWNGRGARVRDGILVARLRVPGDVRRFALRRRGGRYRLLAPIETPPTCTLLQRARLSRAAVGGRRGLSVRFRVRDEAEGRVVVRQRGRTILSGRSRTRLAGPTYRVSVPSRGLRRGKLAVRITVSRPGERVVRRLVARVVR